MGYKILNTEITTNKNNFDVKIVKIETIKKEMAAGLRFKAQIDTEKPAIFKTREELNQFLMKYFYEI